MMIEKTVRRVNCKTEEQNNLVHHRQYVGRIARRLTHLMSDKSKRHKA